MNIFNQIANYNESKYARHIKDYCVICGTKIEKSWENYFVRGNYCSPCNNRAENSWHEKAKIRNDKLKQKYEKEKANGGRANQSPFSKLPILTN